MRLFQRNFLLLFLGKAGNAMNALGRVLCQGLIGCVSFLLAAVTKHHKLDGFVLVLGIKQQAEILVGCGQQHITFPP